MLKLNYSKGENKIMVIGPLKLLKLPARLIYKAGSKGNNQYNMFSTKTGEHLGFMRAEKVLLKKSDFYPITEPTPSLYLNKLEALKKGEKVGTDFINFARHLSKKEGAGGRIHLIAYNSNDITKPPQKFYRKLGFTCTRAEDNKIIDDAIKNNTPLPFRLNFGSIMYLEKF